MGYYDQDYKDITEKQKGNGRGWIFTTMVGVFLGALLILFTIPALIKWNVLPYDIAVEQESPTEEQVQGGQPVQEQQLVQVDVVTQVTEAVDKMSDAVVGVVNIQEAGFWSERGQAGTGSGVIYKVDGNNAFIVTNHHVIEGASEVEISLSNGERVSAEILGSDVFTDLAVLRMDASQVEQVAQFGSSEKLRAGEPVIAIGNPLGLRFSGSVTQGIISGLNRTIEIDLNGDGRPDWHSEVLQTDAAINPGNSGGALVNIQGQLIGINSMKIAREAVEGIGLAIPIDTARPIIEDLEKFGEVRRPVMGVGLRSLNEVPSYHWSQSLKLPADVEEGVFIVSVVPLSSADQAGLKELDVIVELDGNPIGDIIELRKYLYKEKEIGDTMEVTFYREGERQTTTMKLSGEAAY